jgi:hypothetical protein
LASEVGGESFEREKEEIVYLKDIKTHVIKI